MGTLFECLKEAKLEKYYPTLRVNGITKSESLAKLSPQDCAAIGITSQEDKRRFIELINIIKSVHSNEPSAFSAERPSNNNTHSPRKRNRSPLVSASRNDRGPYVGSNSDHGLHATNDVRVRERPLPQLPQSAGSHLSQAELRQLLESSDSDTTSEESSDHSDYEPAVKQPNAASSPSKVRRSVVSRIKAKGYNYGVPSNAPSTPTSSRGRSRTTGEEKIKVCVRKRPRNKREIKKPDDDIVQTESDSTLIVNEPKSAVDLRAYTLQHEFMFDEVFSDKCSNEDVYIRATRPLINCVFEGGTASCFAYGQTGAGKTHTMMGNQEIPGQYLLAAHDIYSIIDSKQYGAGLKVWVSFFEIYCGQLFDLLNKRNRLQAREDGSNRVCIAGLTETEAKDVHALMQVIDYGNNARSKGATGVNPDSSRSHAIIQIEVRKSSDQKVGRISFIDLAGSERASDVTDTDRQTRLEGAEINQSLLALKECIRSIDQESKHKPFRQSKLTHILKESFTGNSKTCMIANISPTQSSCEHTLNTLRYADRVKELRKKGILPGARSSVTSSLLLNIPPAGVPSAFHPSNIQCSSTPMRRTSRQASSHRDNSAERDLHLDPNETPIKGHGVKRKTVTKSASKPAKPKPTPSVPSRTNLVRHVARSSSSQSESDPVDSDSCNVELVQPVKPTTSSQNVPVVRSTDTENDFPTTDFNNDDGLNDLDRTGGKYGTIPVSKATANQNPASALKLSTAGHPLPEVGVDWNEHGAKPKLSSQVASSSSAPVLRQKVYKEENEKNDSETNQIEKTTENRYNGNRSTVIQSNDLSRPKPELKITLPSTPTATPRLSDSSPKHHNQPGVLESFDDDMLFDKPSFQSNISQRTQRTPSNGENGLNNLGLSRGRDAPKTPQDPSVHPILPAMMPAKSSDLTIFSQSQRSPAARFKSNYEQQELSPPPFPLALVNPTESRPKIPRTPPPILTQHNQDSRVDISTILEGVTGHQRTEDNNRKMFDRHNVEKDNSREVQNESPQPLYLEHSPLSTNQWYNTPANFIEHIATSVQKSTNLSSDHHDDGHCSDRKGEPNNNKYKYSMNHSIERNSPHSHVMEHEIDETGLKTVDENIPEFLPIQPKQSYHGNQFTQHRPAQSLSVAHKDVASRLKSAFSRPEPDSSKSRQPDQDKSRSRIESDNSRSKVTQNNLSGYSDSGIATNDTRDTTHASPTPQRKDRHTKSSHRDQSAFSDSDIYRHKDSGSKKGRQPNSRSPASDRSTGSRTPVSKNDKPAYSPVPSSRSASNVVKTEKLGNNSAFSPIHPQPVTSSAITKTTIGQSKKDLVHPKPVVSPTSTDPRNLDIEAMSGRQKLISSHEDQLASVTSLCKQEMKLLLGAKAGQRTFDEYIQRVSGILSQKLSAIRLLQEQIDGYIATQLQHDEAS